MYTLTLTADERRAIDWIGNRYEHGDDLSELLCRSSVSCLHEWSDNCDATFEIPENVAWQIKDLLQNCNFECFSEELVAKFANFLEGIV